MFDNALREKFEKDLNFAEVGEEKCWLTLLKSPKTKVVLDVREDKYFQKYDVDFLQMDVDGQAHKVEVKTDRKAHETGNMAYELTSNGNKGCLARSIADYVYYYLNETGETYVVHLPSLRLYLNVRRFEERNMGDGATGYLIPLKELVEKGIAWKK